MNERSVPRRHKISIKRSVGMVEPVVESRPEQTLASHDGGLLERARTQWQFGDWQSLAQIDRDTLEHHPDRAKLALLAAAGRLQTGGNDSEARQFIRLAQSWGASRKLINQILIAGVHNSLGRAAAISNQQQRASQHFENAITGGMPGSDTKLLTRARSNEQFAQLSLKSPQSNKKVFCDKIKYHSPISPKIAQPSQIPSIFIDMFFSEHEGDRARSLDVIKEILSDIPLAEDLPDISWVSVEHRGQEFFFTHFFDDYIPKKMAEKKQFYESPFLNLLARLHQPGKLIVDGGANIGNHTMFFAGVIGAAVIAFEPQPFNYEFLIANVQLNHLEEEIEVRKVALGDQTKRVSLVQALPNNYGSFTADTTLVKQDDKDIRLAASFDVQTSTLDAELADCPDGVSIIKLDLEGMELDALHGARDIIARSLPVIAVECFTRSVYQKIKEYLGTFDYFVIDSTNATPTFIFLTRRNPQHLKVLSKYLEISAVGKFAAASSFVGASHGKK